MVAASEDAGGYLSGRFNTFSLAFKVDMKQLQNVRCGQVKTRDGVAVPWWDYARSLLQCNAHVLFEKKVYKSHAINTLNI
jgi:hypothetical protein